MSIFADYNFCSIFIKISFTSVFIYAVFSVRLWLNYGKTLNRTTFAPDPHKYLWIQSLLFFFIFIMMVIFFQLIFTGIRLGKLYIPFEHITHFLVLVFVIFIQYQSFIRPEWLQKISTNDSTILHTKITDESFKETDEQNTKDLEQIKIFLLKEKLFLESNLTIKELADKMKWSARKISMIINSFSGTNFSDYINRMRIEEACNRFINPNDSKETISEVYFDCGFNSRSVFNSLFKMYPGYTPSSFKKKHL